MRCTLLALVGVLSCTAQAATFYVSPIGSNGNAGSEAAPWQTLQFAADTIAPGDTVIVKPGTYAGFNVKTSGLTSQHSVFSAQPGVLINTAAAAYNGTTHLSRINLDTVSHVTISGFEVVGSNDSATSREGIRIVAPLGAAANDIVIRNNHVHHNRLRNIFTGYVGNLRIENNTVNNAFVEHGIYVSNSADNHVIRNNVSFANRGSGIQINADGTLPGDGIITNALVENNRIYGNGGGGGGSAINLDGVQSSVIQNNLLYHNHASGISLFRQDGAGGSTGNLVANNTVINASDGRWALNIQDGSSGNTALNNILFSLSANGAIDIDPTSQPGFVSDYNILENRFTLNDGASFITIAAFRAGTGGDANSSTVTKAQLMALFRDLAGEDFQLADGSAAIDAGIASLLNGTARNAPLYDLLGAARPAGEGFDAGAFEAQPIPEPQTWVMLLAGGVLVGGVAARRRAKKS